jgi:UDP-N-acetyl-D-mannosaminuronate dehydrogenase
MQCGWLQPFIDGERLDLPTTYEVRIEVVDEQLIAAAGERTALGQVSRDIRWLLDAVWAHLARAIDLITNEAQLLRKTRIGLFGVTFKVGSDDVRSSPSLELVRALAGRYQVGAFDEDLMKAPELTGVNLERWSELRADHPIEMFTSRAGLLQACDIVVLAKAGAISRADLETSLTRDQAVVDLVGDLAGVTLKQRIARLT